MEDSSMTSFFIGTFVAGKKMKLLSVSYMKNFLRILFFLLIQFPVGVLRADDFPPQSKNIVTDYTNTLSAGELQSLEQKLSAFNDSTSSQVAIVMMASVGNYDIADYTVQLYNKWGIGQKEKNNGVLILVAKEDRKVWITTGYGLEGVFPDALAKRVVNNDILPNFKEGNYYEGLDEGVNSIMSIVKGEYTSDNTKHKKEKVPWFGVLLALFVFFIVIISKVGSTRNYARRNNLGFWAAWALMNAAMNRNRSRGSWGGFSSGSGGFGGGGGFGGFGGGMSGGGGAGGSW
jgi:uncharacterized protein